MTDFDTVSRERVRLVAEQIATVTGLEVDIMLGSSPAPQQVELPAGQFGRPELLLAEEWSLKGVAVAVVELARWRRRSGGAGFRWPCCWRRSDAAGPHRQRAGRSQAVGR